MPSPKSIDATSTPSASTLTLSAPDDEGVVWSFDPMSDRWSVEHHGRRASHEKRDALLKTLKKWQRQAASSSETNVEGSGAPWVQVKVSCISVGMGRGDLIHVDTLIQSPWHEVLADVVVRGRSRQGPTWSIEDWETLTMQTLTYDASFREAQDRSSVVPLHWGWMIDSDPSTWSVDDETFWRELCYQRVVWQRVQEAQRDVHRLWLNARPDATRFYTHDVYGERGGVTRHEVREVSRKNVTVGIWAWALPQHCPVLVADATQSLDGWSVMDDDGEKGWRRDDVDIVWHPQDIKRGFELRARVAGGTGKSVREPATLFESDRFTTVLAMANATHRALTEDLFKPMWCAHKNKPFDVILETPWCVGIAVMVPGETVRDSGWWALDRSSSNTLTWSQLPFASVGVQFVDVDPSLDQMLNVTYPLKIDQTIEARAFGKKYQAYLLDKNERSASQALERGLKEGERTQDASKRGGPAQRFHGWLKQREQEARATLGSWEQACQKVVHQAMQVGGSRPAQPSTRRRFTR